MLYEVITDALSLEALELRRVFEHLQAHLARDVVDLLLRLVDLRHKRLDIALLVGIKRTELQQLQDLLAVAEVA